jgi:H+/Cl- antiporter ClcA
MNWRHYTIIVLLTCVFLLGLVEFASLMSKAKGDTISEIMRDLAHRLGRLWMILPLTVAFICGLLTGHFRWLLPSDSTEST